MTEYVDFALSDLVCISDPDEKPSIAIFDSNNFDMNTRNVDI